MEVKNAHLMVLQNEEHFRFMTYFDEAISELGADALEIPVQYATFKLELSNERIALDNVQKSSFTKRLDAADAARDIPIRGFMKVVKGMLHHYNPLISDAAYTVYVINESFSNITRLSDGKQSAATVSYLDAIKASNANVITLGLADWVVQIEAKETDYLALQKSSLSEEDAKSTLTMKQARKLTDVQYNSIVDRINAFITIQGDAQFATFVTRINNRIDSFNLAIAQRKGRRESDDKKSSETK